MTDTPAPKPKRGVIMLVDDDRFLLDMYSTKFLHADFSVEACQSAKEALTILRAGVTPVAILFDIVMPESDGFNFLKTIQTEKLQRTSILIALTNQSNDSDQEEATKLGADKFVVKATMIPSEVVAMVEEELQKK